MTCFEVYIYGLQMGNLRAINFLKLEITLVSKSAKLIPRNSMTLPKLLQKKNAQKVMKQTFSIFDGLYY